MVHMVQNRDNRANIGMRGAKANLELEIMLALLKGENHLRAIAKLLDASHSTVSRTLARLLQENVLDFKTEGKNKVFFIKKNLQAKNYVFNAERYKLIRLLKQYPELGIIIEDVLKNCDATMILLFGSCAKGTAKKDSDIDIYVETAERKIKDKIDALHSKISVKIGSFDTRDQLIKEIVKNHIILKGVDDFYDRLGFFE